MDNTIENKTLQELQSRFEALCDEQEQLPREGFAKVFEVLDGLEETFTPQHPYSENKDNVNKALELTGHSTDEAFCKAFKRNNQIMVEGKKIQEKGLEIFAIQQCEKMKENPHDLNEWQFVPIRIFAPKEIMDNVINPRLEADAHNGKGLFANITNIPLEDVNEDDFAMIDVYDCTATFTKYLDELKNFEIIGRGKTDAFFSLNFKEYLFKSLKYLATYIKEHTNTPAQTKNEITETIKKFDEIPICGLFFQILILQGLCRWMESVNINEGDKGYDEAQSFYNWLTKALGEKLMSFCFVPYGDKDKELLKPLCNYLYSTEIGKAVQATLIQRKDNNSFMIDGHGTKKIPKELESHIKTTVGESLPSKQEQKEAPKRGRRSKPFKDYLQSDDGSKLQTLHSIMNGKKGKEAALVIKVAIQVGWITKPTFKAVTDEFGDIGNRSNYNKCLSENKFTSDEIEGMKTQLKE